MALSAVSCYQSKHRHTARSILFQVTSRDFTDSVAGLGAGKAMLSCTLVATSLPPSLVLARPLPPLVTFPAIYGLVLPGTVPLWTHLVAATHCIGAVVIAGSCYSMAHTLGGGDQPEQQSLLEVSLQQVAGSTAW